MSIILTIIGAFIALVVLVCVVLALFVGIGYAVPVIVRLLMKL